VGRWLVVNKLLEDLLEDSPEGPEERIVEVDWEKVDPTGRHRDAVAESLLPLLGEIAKDEGCEVLDLSWAVTRCKG
jgi:hypothetical protein